MSWKHAIILLLLAGLVLRLGWSLSRGSDLKSLSALPDQIEYLQAGANLAADEGLWFTDSRFGQRIYAGRMPGYPLFVALCGGNVKVIRVVQALVDLSTALVVFLIARKWLTARRALFAAALVVVNPLLVYFSGLVLSETLYVAMLAWSVYLVLERRTALLGLMLCALAIHVRPSGFVMPVMLGLLAPWAMASERPVRSGLVAGGAAVVMIFLVLAPWAMRNNGVLGRSVWLTTNGGVTLYDGVHPGATGASDQRFVAEMPELREMSELQRDDHFNRLGHEAIKAEPGRFARLALVKTARTWSPIPLSEQFGSNKVYVLAGLGYGVPLFVLTLWGLFWSELPWRVRVLLIAPAVAITAMHAVTVGSMRYRLPAEPLLAVVAASFVVGARAPRSANGPMPRHQ